jgi:hypothetical protein
MILDIAVRVSCRSIDCGYGLLHLGKLVCNYGTPQSAHTLQLQLLTSPADTPTLILLVKPRISQVALILMGSLVCHSYRLMDS